MSLKRSAIAFLHDAAIEYSDFMGEKSEIQQHIGSLPKPVEANKAMRWLTTLRSRCTAAAAALARSENIYKEQRFSDHAPVTVGYDFSL